MDDELRLERRLRAVPGLVPALTLLAGASLFSGVAACLELYRLGYWPITFLAALLVHAFMVMMVYDGTHRSITRNGFVDSLLLNLAAGLTLLPFYGEPFRRYHLIHHAHTNSPADDPLWTPFKRRLFAENRRRYIACELIPLAFNFVSLLDSGRRAEAAHRPPEFPLRVPWMVFSFLVSAAVIALVRSRSERVPRTPRRSGRCGRCSSTLGCGITEDDRALPPHYPHYSTTTTSVCPRPNVSGAYISSARGGGATKRPGVVARTR